jgi:hypothetical protein
MFLSYLTYIEYRLLRLHNPTVIKHLVFSREFSTYKSENERTEDILIQYIIKSENVLKAENILSA